MSKSSKSSEHPDVKQYLKNATQWHEEITELRALLIETDLDEDFKWSKPCYTFEGSNIAIIQPFKSALALMFFKGTLLKDPKGVLKDNGPNSRSARRLEFTSLQDIAKAKATIRAYIKEAIDIEKSGQKVEPSQSAEALPDELQKLFKAKPTFKKAFEGLTPGRQRAYLLHFSSAKQSATRLARIEKCMPRIMKGLGLSDR